FAPVPHPGRGRPSMSAVGTVSTGGPSGVVRGGNHPPVVALVGPTASGKSRIAVDIARASMGGPFPVELVSVDSMAVYRGMDVGTAKPGVEVRAEVAVHVVDVVDPDEEFTVQQFQSEAGRALEGISSRRHAALLVGGTGLYLRSVVDRLTFPGRYPAVAAELAASVEAAGPEGSRDRDAVLVALHDRLGRLDPVAARRVAPSNCRRLLRALEVTVGSGRPFSSFGPGLERYPPTPVPMIGIASDPVTLDRRIAERFGRMMADGLLDEVEALATRPGGLSRTARQALGYRELLAHLDGALSLEEAVGLAVQRTKAFARRQLAWFRRDPRIVWLSPDDDPVRSILARLGWTRSTVGWMGNWTEHDESASA
ncbi:MAG: tRNA (adenosine(37)-N6)-dimethylallyltransferase MiaA, partial [Acidimicrobiales bacterium]